MGRAAQQKLQQLDQEPAEATTSASNMNACSDAPAKDGRTLEESAGTVCEN
jgi:hypothetical protein